MVFRENFNACVRCGTALELERTLGHSFRRCPTCRGIWIEHVMLRCMLSDMSSAFVPRPQRPEPASGSRPHACPICASPMESIVLCGVVIEQCRAHGLWCENLELEEILRRAAEQR